MIMRQYIYVRGWQVELDVEEIFKLLEEELEV